MISSLKPSHVVRSSQTVSLDAFVAEWLQHYKEGVAAIDLFNPELTETLSPQQRAFFVKAFYHARGHFHDFLWFVGNHTSYEVKQLIIDNVAEEFGGEGRSHEQFYYEFAAAIGVDLTDEVVNETTHLPFIQDYNRAHLRWLASHDADSLLAAFSAYEKLDNPDYSNLYALGKSFELNNRGLIFFDVHRHVEHYEATMSFINQVWERNPDKVVEAFEFVGKHQLNMWRQLSDAVFAIA